jgi:CheY-like chemotaxis protein
MTLPFKSRLQANSNQEDNILLFLIDDDEDDRELFSIAAADLAYPVSCLSSGLCTEALEVFDKGHVPDLIFLDLNMPRMSGKECLSELKRREDLKHIPVIIFTTSSDPSDKETLMNMGAADFITKPARIHQLTELLDQIIHTVIVKDHKKNT